MVTECTDDDKVEEKTYSKLECGKVGPLLAQTDRQTETPPVCVCVQVPMMLRSEFCWLSALTDKERAECGECIFDQARTRPSRQHNVAVMCVCVCGQPC